MECILLIFRKVMVSLWFKDYIGWVFWIWFFCEVEEFWLEKVFYIVVCVFRFLLRWNIFLCGFFNVMKIINNVE